MDTDTRWEERNFLREFIDCYRQLPACWNSKSPDYSNRALKEVQIQKLFEKYREFYPSAAMRDMMKKINSLRSNFKRELKRIELVRQSSGPEADSPVSHLWYFDIFSFIVDGDDSETPATVQSGASKDKSQSLTKKKSKPAPLSPTPTTNPKQRISVVPLKLIRNDYSAPKKPKTLEIQPVESIISEPTIQTLSQSLSRTQSPVNSMSPGHVSQPIVPNLMMNTSETEPARSQIDDLMRVVCQKLTENNGVFMKEAEVWAMKLQNMDNTQALIAGKLINEIIFQGQMGNLHLNLTLADTRVTTTNNIQVATPHIHFANTSNEAIYVD